MQPPPHSEATAFSRWDMGASDGLKTPFETHIETMSTKGEQGPSIRGFVNVRC